MSIRLSSVCLPVRQLFFSNRKGSLSFRPIYPIFGLDVHHYISQKVMEVEFGFFFHLFLFQWIFNYKENMKMSFFVFGHFLKKFLIWEYETWFTGTLWVLSGVCVKWLLWGKFSGHLGPKIGRNIGFRIYTWKFSTGFTRNLIYKLNWATFWGE